MKIRTSLYSHKQNRKALALALAILILPCAVSAHDGQPSPAPSRSLQTQNTQRNSYLDNYFQCGFHVCTDIRLSTKQLSATDRIENHMSAGFGFFARGGYQFIFGEIGLHYMFYKGYFEVTDENLQPVGNENVENRYLDIPVQIVGYWAATKSFALIPKVGISYQPLLQVTKNDINYGKGNITRHQCLFQASVGCKIKFLTVDIGYRKALKPYFSNQKSVKPSYLNLMLGFQF